MALALGITVVGVGRALADETRMSPYMARITSQEGFVCVWTLGERGVGDGSDNLVAVDVRPESRTRGRGLHSLSVGGRHEARHAGFSDDRRPRSGPLQDQLDGT